MEIPDSQVYQSLLKVAAMEPQVKRAADFINNGVLDERIQKAVIDGIKSCPFYIEGKAKRKISSVVRWVLTLCAPILVTILTLFATGVLTK